MTRKDYKNNIKVLEQMKIAYSNIIKCDECEGDIINQLDSQISSCEKSLHDLNMNPFIDTIECLDDVVKQAQEDDKVFMSKVNRRVYG